jgi:HPt (histidine-containing phosphotransfer) domain-containing protein
MKQSASNEEKFNALRQIEGLDADAGLKTIANMLPAYLRILGLFVKSQNRDEGLLDELLDRDDMEEFRTTVHGYKSALANIGALNCSVMADELEKSAVENDRNSIEKKLPAFKESISILAERLRDVLD